MRFASSAAPISVRNAWAIPRATRCRRFPLPSVDRWSRFFVTASHLPLALRCPEWQSVLAACERIGSVSISEPAPSSSRRSCAMIVRCIAGVRGSCTSGEVRQHLDYRTRVAGCASELSPARDLFVVDSSPVVPDRSRRFTPCPVRYRVAARAGAAEHLRDHDPGRGAEELNVGETGGRPRLPLRVDVYGIIGDQEEDLGTLTGLPLPIQEGRCRSGSGSCSG